MGCKYVLNGEDTPDLLDNVYVLTCRQAVAQEDDTKGMWEGMQGEPGIVSSKCEGDASMTLAETVIKKFHITQSRQGR